MNKFSTKLKIYSCFLYLVTFYSLYNFIMTDYNNVKISDFRIVIFFTILMALTESFSVEFKDIFFSTGFAVTIAAFIIQGPLAALIVVVIGYSLRVIKSDGVYLHILNTPKTTVFMNFCILILPILAGFKVYTILHGAFGGSEFKVYLLPISLFSLVAFLLNVIFIGIFFSLRNNDKSILFYIAGNIKLGALNFLATAPLGILAAYLFYPNNYGRILLFIFPLVLARFTFSLYIEANNKYIQTVDVMMHAMEARDKYTEGHSRRVADISCMIAKELKFNEWKMEDLKMAALMHDAGKIGIDDNILNKPDKLTEEEYNSIKQHPEIGYRILKNIKDIEYVLEIVRYHHERYDGKGYPEGKKSDELSIDVFIVQLADSIDAMATDRPYRKAMTQDYIVSELEKFKGSQFHPVVVDAYLKAIHNNKK
jgi:HD superfamily phosphohydrolase YqeK